MPVRGIRGANTVSCDEPEVVFSATRELLVAILQANPGLELEDIASAFFTVTPDIKSAFPAQAARKIGWQMVPLMCSTEIPVESSLGLCIRILILWNTKLPQSSIRHVYLGDAACLRPDLNC